MGEWAGRNYYSLSIFPVCYFDREIPVSRSSSSPQSPVLVVLKLWTKCFLRAVNSFGEGEMVGAEDLEQQSEMSTASGDTRYEVHLPSRKTRSKRILNNRVSCKGQFFVGVIRKKNTIFTLL